MTKKARDIRKYQVSFEMTKKEAEAHYDKMQAQNAAQPKVKANLYHSETLDQLVTIPE